MRKNKEEDEEEGVTPGKNELLKNEMEVVHKIVTKRIRKLQQSQAI